MAWPASERSWGTRDTMDDNRDLKLGKVGDWLEQCAPAPPNPGRMARVRQAVQAELRRYAWRRRVSQMMPGLAAAAGLMLTVWIWGPGATLDRTAAMGEDSARSFAQALEAGTWIEEPTVGLLPRLVEEVENMEADAALDDGRPIVERWLIETEEMLAEGSLPRSIL